jgi:hypothetical protein
VSVVRGLAFLLFAGSLALLTGVALHPILPLTADGDLSLISATRHWYTIHVVLLYATGMIITGIWSRWLVAEGAERPGLAVGFAVLGVGQALNAVNIAYMAGAGTLLARLASEGQAVGTLYEATHLSAIMCGRLSGFMVSIAAGVIAIATARGAEEPRWLVGIAWIACVGGLAGNLLATPGHPLMLASVGLMAAWQVATATRLLGSSSMAPRPVDSPTRP